MKKLIFVFFALFGLSLQTTLANAYPIYPHLNQMLLELKNNCSESDLEYNHSYELLQEYKNKKEMHDFIEFSMMEQTNWINYKDRTCSITLAKNTIKGMEFIQQNRPKTSYMHSDSNLAIARALTTLWLYNPKSGEPDLSKIKQLLNAYLKSSPIYNPEEQTNHFLAAEAILGSTGIESANGIEDFVSSEEDAPKIIALLKIAVDISIDGVELAANKELNYKNAQKLLIYLAERQKTSSDEQSQTLQRLSQFKPIKDGYLLTKLAMTYGLRGDFRTMQNLITQTKDDQHCWRLDKKITQTFPREQQEWLILASCNQSNIN